MSKVKMRPVTTSKMQSMRRCYNKAIDGDELADQPTGNPYQSMYSQAFGAGSSEKKHRSNLYTNMMTVTPNKKRMSMQQYHKSATR